MKNFTVISLTTFLFLSLITLLYSSNSFANSDDEYIYENPLIVPNVIECRYQDGGWHNLLSTGLVYDCGAARVQARVEELELENFCSVTATNRLIESQSVTTGVTYVTAKFNISGSDSCNQTFTERFRIIYKETEGQTYSCRNDGALKIIDGATKCEYRNFTQADICPVADVEAITSFTLTPNESVCYQVTPDLNCRYTSNESNFYLLPVELALMEPVMCSDAPKPNDDVVDFDLSEILASMDVLGDKLVTIDNSVNSGSSDIADSISSLDLADNSNLESLGDDINELNDSNKTSNDQIIQGLSDIKQGITDSSNNQFDDTDILNALNELNTNFANSDFDSSSLLEGLNSINSETSKTNDHLSNLPNTLSDSLSNNDSLLSEINDGIKGLLDYQEYNVLNPDDVPPLDECVGELCDSTYEEDMKSISKEIEEFVSSDIEPPSELTSLLSSYPDFIKNNFAGFTGQCLPFVLEVSVAGVHKEITVNQHCQPYETYFKPLVVWILYTITFISFFNIVNQTLRTFSNS